MTHQIGKEQIRQSFKANCFSVLVPLPKKSSMILPSKISRAALQSTFGLYCFEEFKLTHSSTETQKYHRFLHTEENTWQKLSPLLPFPNVNIFSFIPWWLWLRRHIVTSLNHKDQLIVLSLPSLWDDL